MDLSGVLSEALTGAVKDHEPRIFTQASYEQRKLDLMEAHDKGEKEFRRLKLVIDWKVLHVVFKGREENPIDTAEYVAYRDLKLAELPPEAGDPQFTHEGYRVVSKINWDLKDELHKAFAGRYNVDSNEVWMKAAEMRVAQDKRLNIGIDASAPCVCSNKKCGNSFVPFLWDFTIKVKNQDSGQMETVTITTGHFLAKDGEVLCVCRPCRESAVEQAKLQGKKLYFFCEEEAEFRANKQKSAIAFEERQAQQDERRQERREERKSGGSEIGSDIFKPKLKRGYSAKHGRGNGMGNRS